MFNKSDSSHKIFSERSASNFARREIKVVAVVNEKLFEKVVPELDEEGKKFLEKSKDIFQADNADIISEE